MSDKLDEISFEHDIERETFEAIIGDDRAVLEYRSNKEGKFFITSTEVPSSLEDRGVANILLNHVFDYIRQNNFRVIPICPAVKIYLKENPELMELVVSGIRVD